MTDTPENTPVGELEVDEAVVAAETTSSTAAPNNPKQAKIDRNEEKARNVKAVFGSGAGKFAIVSAAVFVVIAMAMGIRGLNAEPETIQEGELATVDQPKAPRGKIDDGPITQKEAERRAAANAADAEAARLKGETFQPKFDTNIVDAAPAAAGTPGESSQVAFPGLPGSPPVPRGNAANASAAPDPVNVPSAAGADKAGTESESAAFAAQEQKRKEDEQARDRYLEKLKELALKEVTGLIGDGRGQGGINVPGRYSSLAYPSARATVASDAAALAGAPAAASGVSGNLSNPKVAPLIKTGNILYATLDSEVNTDEGIDVLATIRGGAWDGAKLIGRVEQNLSNIRLIFNLLAPQDDRTALKISAIALREQDAKQGMAENINNHVLSRYGSLAAASLLSGYGKAFAYTPGTTVTTATSTTTTTQEPSDKQIYGQAIGEFGSALSAEVKRGFNRQPTYSTPANQGFALFFMNDVFPQ